MEFSTVDDDTTPTSFEKFVSKGVPRHMLRKLNKEQFVEALSNRGLSQNIRFKCFRLEKHRLYLLKLNKRSLSSFDTKRRWNESNDPFPNESVPFGYDPI